MKKFDYLGPEWRDEAEKGLRAELTPEKMKFLTTSVTYSYKNCPGGGDKFLYFSCENGAPKDFLVGAGDGPVAEFKIIGDYDLYSKITQGIIKSHTALMTGKLKVKGNMVKALKLASLADRINKILAAVPTNY
jgi:putative sterol carrier protein